MLPVTDASAFWSSKRTPIEYLHIVRSKLQEVWGVEGRGRQLCPPTYTHSAIPASSQLGIVYSMSHSSPWGSVASNREEEGAQNAFVAP